jgi:hypothetical protein
MHALRRPVRDRMWVLPPHNLIFNLILKQNYPRSEVAPHHLPHLITLLNTV